MSKMKLSVASISILASICCLGAVGQYRGDQSDTDRLADTTISGGVNTNMYSYTTELGRLKSKQEVVVGVREKNFLKRGITTWTDDDELDETFGTAATDIFGSGVQYNNMTGVSYNQTAGLTIKDPITGTDVQAAYYLRDTGFEYVSILGTCPWFSRYNEAGTHVGGGGAYYGVTASGYQSTLPYSFGTNATLKAECRQMAFPDKLASASTRNLKNVADINGIKHSVIADREWVLNLVTNILNSAGYNISVTVDANGKITTVSK